MNNKLTTIQLNQGDLLFKYRGLIPVPIIVLTIIYFYLYGREDISDEYYLLCIIISFIGLIIRILTIGFTYFKTSGKNTKRQIARKLNTTGVYSLVRNPLYLANYINWLGIILLLSDPIIAVISTLIFIIIYREIILIEENFLLEKFNQNYQSYSNKTPRIIPSFKNWVKPENEFNLVKSLINIKNGLFALSIVFYLINSIEIYKTHGVIFQMNWIFCIMLFSIFFYLIIKIYLINSNKKF